MSWQDGPLHPLTLSQLQNYLKQPVQPLAVVGATGRHSRQLVLELAGHLLKQEPAAAINKGTLTVVEPPDEKSEISIEAVRHLISRLKTKAGIGRYPSRIVFIDQADKLSLAAQNAFLKTLEEPNPGVLIMMSVNSRNSLLPTIVSRLSTIELRRLSLAQAQVHYEAYSPAQIESAWLLSDGEASLMSELLAGSGEELRRYITQAKTFLRAKPLDRLVLADNLSKNKSDMAVFLQALGKVLRAAHHAAVRKQRPLAGRLLASRKQIMDLTVRLEANSSPKLIGLNLATGLAV